MMGCRKLVLPPTGIHSGLQVCLRFPVGLGSAETTSSTQLSLLPYSGPRIPLLEIALSICARTPVSGSAFKEPNLRQRLSPSQCVYSDIQLRDIEVLKFSAKSLV